MSKLSHYRHDIGMSSLPWRIHALLAWSDLLHPLKNRPNDLQISLMSATSSNDCENKLICLSVHQRKIITHSPIESPSLAPRGFSSSLHDYTSRGFPVLDIPWRSFQLQDSIVPSFGPELASVEAPETCQLLQGKPPPQSLCRMTPFVFPQRSTGHGFELGKADLHQGLNKLLEVCY